jgi:hypothetical protein
MSRTPGSRRPIGGGHIGHPRCIVGVVWAGRVSQRIQYLLEPQKSSGIFQRPAPGALDQPYGLAGRFKQAGG